MIFEVVDIAAESRLVAFTLRSADGIEVCVKTRDGAMFVPKGFYHILRVH